LDNIVSPSAAFAGNGASTSIKSKTLHWQSMNTQALKDIIVCCNVKTPIRNEVEK